ncbi:MAG: DUF4832 domain-containing protein [Bacteroidetes bacterium]|nr:DUF4832 domain-containing protein [Bacteroidota bacterium]MBU1117056.1 DUF4832 domain-containing protein [Bacteroidota bacterium]MBU1797651.1 DUF4832 domain-containing protein [Bacteroidota bacterium]
MLGTFKITIYVLILMTLTIYSQNTSSINYVISDKIITNPERGFSAYRSEPITNMFINTNKENQISVIQRIYTIPEFVDKPLSDAFLNMVRADLNMARAGGMKLVLRFSYTDSQNGADAPLNIILNHVNQIKPLFEENYDVISYVEAGFIGAWGEWYYSSNGLNNTANRRTVLFALLDALPKERAVVVRTPSYKRDIFENNAPLTFSEAFNGTYRSRTGAHNDCFLASATDFGTYVDSDVEGDKNFLNLDNRFVPQGGETCSPSAYSGCDNALIDLERLHWSILNKDYNTQVINGWETGVCIDDIKKYLGYRFILIDGEFTNSIKPSGIINIKLTLFNDGFASLYNPHNLEFVLRNTITNKRYRLLSNVDTRGWMSNETVLIELSAGILPTMERGDYELLMHIADPTKTLHDRVEYSIRLANENLWEESTGFNKLLHTVEINTEAIGDNYLGEDYFIEEKSDPFVESDMKIDGEFSDWSSVSKLDVSPDEEFEGDGINTNVDLNDIWLTDDKENVFISYNLAGDFTTGYFYHVLFDLDQNPNTGFHMNNSYAGIDLMIENEVMWEYTGKNGEWGWSLLGAVNSSIGNSEKNRIEMLISKSLLNQFIQLNAFDVVFNVNNLDENSDDDYAPNSYLQKSYTYNYHVTSIEETNIIPSEYYLKAYPNPFNGEINLVFNINHKNIKSAGVYDILGRLVKPFEKDEISKNNIRWNAKDKENKMLGSGIYFFVLSTTKKVLSTKLVLLK